MTEHYLEEEVEELRKIDEQLQTLDPDTREYKQLVAAYAEKRDEIWKNTRHLVDDRADIGEALEEGDYDALHDLLEQE